MFQAADFLPGAAGVYLNIITGNKNALFPDVAFAEYFGKIRLQPLVELKLGLDAFNHNRRLFVNILYKQDIVL